MSHACGADDSAKSELESVPAAAGTAGDGADETGTHAKQPPRRVSFLLLSPDVLPPPPSLRRPLDFSFAGPGGLPLPPPGSTYVVRADGAAPPRRAVLPLSSARPTTDESDSTLTAETAPGPHLRVRSMVRSWERRKQAPAALCFTACCLLVWLLALAIGFALLVVYLRYHHLQPPRMRVTTATLLKNSSNS